MAGKSNRKHGRSKRKPCDQRYKAEMRWQANKKASTSRGKREAAKHAAKHARRGTLGYRARQVARNERSAA
jgi:hypothetical protein